MDERTGLPVVGMVGAGQLARMTHQAAIALGQSLRRARRLRRRRRRAGRRRCRGRRLPLPRRPAGVRRAAATSSPSTTSTCRTTTSPRSRPTASACSPAAEALRFAQDKAADARAAGRAGRAVPALGAGPDRPRRSRRSPPRSAGRSCSRPRAAATTARASGSSARPPRPPRCSPRAPRCSPRRQVPIVRELAAGRRPLAVRAGRGVAGGRDRPARRHLRRGDRARARSRRRTGRARPQALALRIASELGVTGVLAVELFQTADGLLVVNELAMRPHNSAHWTIEGSRDLAVRAAPARGARLPARRDPPVAPGRGDGQPARRPGRRRPEGHRRAGAPLHGPAGRTSRSTCTASSSGPGRKVGHVTALGDDLADGARRAPPPRPTTS